MEVFRSVTENRSVPLVAVKPQDRMALNFRVFQIKLTIDLVKNLLERLKVSGRSP